MFLASQYFGEKILLFLGKFLEEICLIERKNLIENVSAAISSSNLPKKTPTRPPSDSGLLPKSMFWQPRNTLHIYVSPSCLLRGFVFFGAECTDLQGLKNVRNSTLCIQQQKMLFNFLSSRYPADTLQNVRCFCAWLCFLEGLPKESYTVSVAFLPHH